MAFLPSVDPAPRLQLLDAYRRKHPDVSLAPRGPALKLLSEMYLADCWVEWPVAPPAIDLTSARDMLNMA